MSKYGLLGEKLSHSYSPGIHGMLGDYEYGLYEVPPEGLDAFMKDFALDGMNVTIPYKKTVLKYCKFLSDAVKRIGCVNTIVNVNSILCGYNTDYYGFSYLVGSSGIDVRGKKALILGSGGASLSVKCVLEDLGAADIVVISRSGPDNYENIDRHCDADVIVNTTPVGMYPDTGSAAVDLSRFENCSGVLDIIYNPLRTALLMDAERLNIRNAGGLEMLVAQAKKSAELFTGDAIPDAKIAEIARVIRSNAENIVLIGMPGCGKSTIGRALAEKLGRTFIDIDSDIESRSGKTIPEIFIESGEAAFRRLETGLLSEYGKRSGLVIATGGGFVTVKSNYPLLHQNGRMIWIRRDINTLPSEGRPISMTTDITELYEARRDKYEAFSDIVIDNDGSAADAVSRIMEELK